MFPGPASLGPQFYLLLLRDALIVERLANQRPNSSIRYFTLGCAIERLDWQHAQLGKWIWRPRAYKLVILLLTRQTDTSMYSGPLSRHGTTPKLQEEMDVATL